MRTECPGKGPSLHGSHPYNGDRRQTPMTPVHHSVEHYENFPVASWLMPARLRPAVVAIYRFARHADDLADEGDLAPPDRLAALARLTDQVQRARTAAPVTDPVVAELVPHVRTHDLPWSCFEDLLSAFAQDVCIHRFANEAQVMDYCARSANPVGRLMLALTGTCTVPALSESDAICSALQRINFLQDLAIDWPRGRQAYREAYDLLPEADRRAQRPGLIMAAIYSTLLDEIERDDFQVLDRRTSLTPIRKLWLAWRTWVRSAPPAIKPSSRPS